MASVGSYEDVYDQDYLSTLGSSIAAQRQAVQTVSTSDSDSMYDAPFTSQLALISQPSLPFNVLQKRLESRDFLLRQDSVSQTFQPPSLAPPDHRKTDSGGNSVGGIQPVERSLANPLSLEATPSTSGASTPGLITPPLRSLPSSSITPGPDLLKSSSSFLSTGAAFPSLPASVYIKASDLLITEEIGKGEFGMVYAGISNEKRVAIKMIKVQLTPPTMLGKSSAVYAAEEEKRRKDTQGRIEALQREAFIMHAVTKHANVVDFIGVSLLEGQLALVTSYCSNGSVDVWLSKRLSSAGVPPSHRRLMRFSLDAARGVQHLHQNQVIHQDIAARNYLLTSSLDVQVADFGLARFLKPAEVTISDLCAVQWASPEVLNKKEFSAASDCYAYALPFANLQKIQIAFWVAKKGMRLQIDPSWPASIQQLMGACWVTEAAARPPFHFIVGYLESAIKALGEEEDEQGEELDAVGGMQQGQGTRMSRTPSLKSISPSSFVGKSAGGNDGIDARIAAAMAAAATSPPANTMVRVGAKLKRLSKPLPPAPGGGGPIALAAAAAPPSRAPAAAPESSSRFVSATEMQARLSALDASQSNGSAASSTSSTLSLPTPAPKILPTRPLTPDQRKSLLTRANSRLDKLPPQQPYSLTSAPSVSRRTSLKKESPSSIPFTAFSSSPTSLPVDAIALYDYSPPATLPVEQKTEYLSFSRGSVIQLIQHDILDEWWLGSANEKKGKFPANYVCVLERELPTSASVMSAIGVLNEKLNNLQKGATTGGTEEEIARRERASERVNQERQRLNRQLDELKQEEEEVIESTHDAAARPVLLSQLAATGGAATTVSAAPTGSRSTLLNSFLSKQRQQKLRTEEHPPAHEHGAASVTNGDASGSHIIPTMAFSALQHPHIVHDYIIAGIQGKECKGIYINSTTYTALRAYHLPPHSAITPILACVTDIPPYINNRETSMDTLAFVELTTQTYGLIEYCQSSSHHHGLLDEPKELWRWISELANGLNHFHSHQQSYKQLHSTIITLSSAPTSTSTAVAASSSASSSSATALHAQLPPLPFTMNEDELARYQAPESIIEGRADEKSDVWQLGLVMWEVLHAAIGGSGTARRKSSAGTAAIAADVIAARAPRVRVYDETMTSIENNINALLIGIATGEIQVKQVDERVAYWIGKEYCEVMKKCLSHEPQDRPSAAEVASRLQAL